MKIIYNPRDGAPITKYIYLGTMVNPHYQDGYELDGKRYNGLVQYEDDLADAICENFTFLQKVTPEVAKGIIDRKDPEFKCEFPNCNFATTHKIGLAGHQRSHKNGVAEKPVFDESLVPLGGGKRVGPASAEASNEDRFGPELKKGLDADGVEWYGDGAQREQHGFGSVPAQGKGHFVG